MASGQHSWT